MAEKDSVHSLSDICKIPIDGQTHTYSFYRKLIDEYDIVPVKHGPRGGKLYRFEDFVEPTRTHLGEVQDLRNTLGLVGGTKNNTDMAELERQKITEEIKKLQKDNAKKDIQIDVMQKSLVEQNDIIDFLTIRYGLEAAMLRQILFTQVPMDIPGLTVPKAREKCGEYYNKLMDMLEQSIRIFEQDFNTLEDEELREVVKGVFHGVQFDTNTSGSAGAQ